MSDATSMRRRIKDLEQACEDMRVRWDEEVAALTAERDEAQRERAELAALLCRWVYPQGLTDPTLPADVVATLARLGFKGTP